MYIMDNQTLYNEVMAKLTEAQNCQTEIINCNNELQKIYSMGVYDLQSLLSTGKCKISDLLEVNR